MTLPRFAAERRRLQHVARSYRPIFPGHRTLDSKPPAAVSAVDRWDRQTDGRTDVQQLHRPCSPYYKTFKTTAKTSAACCVAWRCEQADGWTGIEEELKLAGFVEFAGVFWHTRGSTAPGAESGMCLVLAGRRVDGHRGGTETGRVRRGRRSLLTHWGQHRTGGGVWYLSCVGRPTGGRASRRSWNWPDSSRSLESSRCSFSCSATSSSRRPSSPSSSSTSTTPPTSSRHLQHELAFYAASLFTAVAHPRIGCSG